MKRLVPLMSVALLVGGIAAATPALAGTPRPSAAQIVGTVQLVDPHTATVQVRYTCTGTPDQRALWVSVKQSANGTADPGLAVEESGYGQQAAAWSQTHAAVAGLDCDGRTHVGRFTVDRAEYGYGELMRGDAYVQFCLFDATTPGEGPEGMPISSMEFVHVR